MEHLTKLERLTKHKHSSLLRPFINYGRKKFYSIDPCYCFQCSFSLYQGPYYKTFSGSKLVRLSLLPYSNICERGWSLPKWSSLQDSATRVGCKACQQIFGNDKRTSLQFFTIIYHHKRVYGTGSRRPCYKTFYHRNYLSIVIS